MVLNRENLNALSRSFRALVLEARESYPKLYPLIADEVESTSRVNYYAWLESIPTVREWVGERQVRNLSAQTFAIENQKFEATVEVLRSDVEDEFQTLIGTVKTLQGHGDPDPGGGVSNPHRYGQNALPQSARRPCPGRFRTLIGTVKTRSIRGRPPCGSLHFKPS